MGPNDETIRLSLDATGVKKGAEEAGDALKKTGDAAEAAGQKIADSTGKAAKGSANLGRSALETGRIVQDFAQGGIGGIINNLESLATALGMGAGVAGAATLAGVAFLTLRKPVGDFFSTLIDGANEVPKATDALSRMNDQLEKGKTRLKELSGQQTLTNTELAEYKRLTEDVLKLEKDTNAERERRNALEAARKQEQAATRDPAAAKAATAAVTAAGGTDKVVADLAPELIEEARKDAEKGLRDLRTAYAEGLKRAGGNTWNTQAMKEFYEPKIREAEAAARQAAQQAGSGRAADLVTAARQGDAAAIEELNRRRPGMGFEGATAFGLARTAAGEEQKRRDDAELARRAKATAERKAADAKEEAAKLAEEEEEDARKAREERRLQEQETRQMNQVGAEAARDAERAAREAPAKAREEMKRRADNAALVQEGRDRAELQNFAASQGVDIPSDQLGPVLDSMRQFMASGANPMEAAAAAMATFLQGNAQTMQRMRTLEAEFRQMQAQARQQMFANGTLLSRGRGSEALTIARGVRAEFDAFAGQMREGMQTTRGRLRRNRR